MNRYLRYEPTKGKAGENVLCPFPKFSDINSSFKAPLSGNHMPQKNYMNVYFASKPDLNAFSLVVASVNIRLPKSFFYFFSGVMVCSSEMSHIRYPFCFWKTLYNLAEEKWFCPRMRYIDRLNDHHFFYIIQGRYLNKKVLRKNILRNLNRKKSN